MVKIKDELKVILKSVLNVILWLWSHFPLCALSDDNNFATLNYDNIRSTKAHRRISLINFMLGQQIIYLFTYNFKEKNLRLCYILRLREMESFVLSQKEIDRIQGTFREHLEQMQEEDLDIEKEKLCYHIQNEEKRVDTSINKINIYSTIILTLLPLVLAILDIKKLFVLSYPLLLGVFSIVYALINICGYIFDAISVQALNKSKFKDLRESQTKKKEILIQYQYDWQFLRRKADLFVSFVLNMQEWVELLLLLAVIVSISISFTESKDQSVPVILKDDTVKTVNMNEIKEPYSDSAIEWQEMILSIHKKQSRKIIFIVNTQEKTSFIKDLMQFDNLETKILRDNSLEKGKIKIIQEE